ncbi:MAG: hypothetical protein ACRDA7_01195 [Metamycoplasmataceae bacterium]
MNKKLLVLLSSLSVTAITPILVTISCTSETPLNSTNLIITIKESPQLTQEDINNLEGNDLSAQLTVLKKLFDGKDLTTENQANFTIVVNKEKNTVTLKAKQGFTISGKDVLENKYTTDALPPSGTNLIITVKESPQLTQEDINTLEGKDLPAQLTVLKKLFDGKDLTTENQVNFFILVNKETKIVTLNAKTGFTINGKDALENKYTTDTLPPSGTNLNVTVKEKPIITNNDITVLEVNDFANQLIVLKKLFDSKDLSLANQTKFSISLDKNQSIVILKAKPGFTINQKESLSSNKYSIETENKDLNISPNTITQTLAAYEVISIKGTNPATQLAILKKLFKGVTVENQNKFKVTTSDKNVVTLTAIDGYTFLGKPTIETTFIVEPPTPPADINLAITSKSNPSITREDVKVLAGTESNKQLIVLQKLFEGIKAENQERFIFEVSENNLIYLIANQGYTFSGKKEIENYFIVEPATTDKNLNITLKGAQALSGVDLINIVGKDAVKQLAVLNKLFNGITNTNQINIVPTIGKDNVITLIAKEGFKFGTKTYLNSNKYTITNTTLNIVHMNTTIAITSAEAYLISNPPVGDIDSEQLNILNKLFAGITNTNYEYFTYSTKDKKVTLTAKSGFVFNDGKTTLEAPAFSILPPGSPAPDS